MDCLSDLHENFDGLRLAPESGGAFFDAGGDLFDCGGAAECADVILSSWLTVGKLAGTFVSAASAFAPPICEKKNGSFSGLVDSAPTIRNGQRIWRAVVEGVAGDFAMAFEISEFRANIIRIMSRATCLGFFVVLLEVTFGRGSSYIRTAERAVIDCRAGVILAGRNTLEDMDIFLNLLGSLFRIRPPEDCCVAGSTAGASLHGRFDFTGERVGFGGVAFFLIQAPSAC